MVEEIYAGAAKRLKCLMHPGDCASKRMDYDDLRPLSNTTMKAVTGQIMPVPAAHEQEMTTLAGRCRHLVEM